jgi:CheY-like chemotaxis protein
MKLELESTATIMPNPFAADLSSNGFDADRLNEMLKAGINAAKEGNRAEARALLLRVTESQPENETAWLWLASISEYPEELLVFLNQVLSVNPHNERALEWSKATKSLLAKTFVQRGITASRESQKDLAVQCFEQALAHDRENELAWLWLASVADSPEEKMAHLEKVLALNPENETAQASFKAVRQQMSQALLKKANVAAISGEHEAAREMLDELMNLSPEMEEAWILKAYLSESHDEKIACFERVLAFNPANETAQAGIDSLNAIKQREVERQQQKAELERLQAAAQAEFEAREEIVSAFEDDEETVSEQPSELFFAESAALQNPPATEEYPDFNFAEDDIHKTSTAEDYQPEALSQDSPTQELEAEFVQKLEVQAAFGHQSPAVEDKNQQEVQEFFMEESSTGNASETAEFCAPATENETKEFTQETEMDKDPQAETTSEFQPVENYAYESKDFEIMTGEDSYFEETSGTNAAEASAEASFAYAEGFEQNPAEGYFEVEDEDDSFSQSSAQNNGYDDGADVQESRFPRHSAETAENSEAFPPTQFFGLEDETSAVEESAVEDEIDEIYVAENETLENYFQAGDEKEADDFEENHSSEESLEAQEASVAAPKAQPVSFACPFCTYLNEPQSFLCPSCQSVLTLSDLEMLLSNQEADRSMLNEAIERMESEKALRPFSADELTALGIAHLNLKNLRKGFSYLQQASQMNQNNVVLGGQVNALAIRLDEIEQHESKTQEAKSCTILVVDDSPTVRKLISGKLEKSGHTVVLAVDGMDALAKINEMVPDLVLLDITMPRMDGYQVCKLIRSNNLTKDVPVVMISGKDGFFDKVRGRMAGSTGYITKPFGPDTLMRTIDAYLN